MKGETIFAIPVAIWIVFVFLVILGIIDLNLPQKEMGLVLLLPVVIIMFIGLAILTFACPNCFSLNIKTTTDGYYDHHKCKDCKHKWTTGSEGGTG